VKHGHKVIIINVISFVIYFGVSTLLGIYTSIGSVMSSVAGFVAAIVVHEILLIMNRRPPDEETAASDLDEAAEQGPG
jgi:uncharacterized membrane protein YagU involved in acid resistance